MFYWVCMIVLVWGVAIIIIFGIFPKFLSHTFKIIPLLAFYNILFAQNLILKFWLTELDTFRRCIKIVISHICCRTDWLLKFLYRTLSMPSHGVAGLAPVELTDRRMCNVDLSDIVSGVACIIWEEVKVTTKAALVYTYSHKELVISPITHDYLRLRTVNKVMQIHRAVKSIKSNFIIKKRLKFDVLIC